LLRRAIPRHKQLPSIVIASMLRFLVALVVVLSLLAGSQAFHVQPARTVATTTALRMGLFDFKPVHGGGSGNDKKYLDEQWETQQAILRERRGHISKDSLKQKYKGGGDNVKFNVAAKDVKPTSGSYSDRMYVADTPSKAKPGASKPSAPSFWGKK
jgi:flagellar biosynthesis protein FliP